jgi:hypothetical protein
MQLPFGPSTGDLDDEQTNPTCRFDDENYVLCHLAAKVRAERHRFVNETTHGEAPTANGRIRAHPPENVRTDGCDDTLDRRPR